MLTDILFLIVFRLISAPTWCFVVTWVLFALNAIIFIFKWCGKIYEEGKKDGSK